MYYHHRALKYVECGKVYPPPISTIDDYMINCYKWIGHYCGYCPQIWLSRSHLSITGYKTPRMLKRRYYEGTPRGKIKEYMDDVLFGFDIIKGFPVSYNFWEYIMNYLQYGKNVEEQNKYIINTTNNIIREMKQDGIKEEEFDSETLAWQSCNGDLDLFLKKYVFVEVDQVVVPSLNLKAAKQIICHDERQKKALRKMGFIEDRIKIKNFKAHGY